MENLADVDSNASIVVKDGKYKTYVIGKELLPVTDDDRGTRDAAAVQGLHEEHHFTPGEGRSGGGDQCRSSTCGTAKSTGSWTRPALRPSGLTGQASTGCRRRAAARTTLNVPGVEASSDRQVPKPQGMSRPGTDRPLSVASRRVQGRRALRNARGDLCEAMPLEAASRKVSPSPDVGLPIRRKETSNRDVPRPYPSRYGDQCSRPPLCLAARRDHSGDPRHGARPGPDWQRPGRRGRRLPGQQRRWQLQGHYQHPALSRTGHPSGCPTKLHPDRKISMVTPTPPCPSTQ